MPGDFARVRHGSTPTDRPAAEHGDINLALRGWSPAPGTALGLIDVDGPTDTLAPKLFTLFADRRVPMIVANYRVHHWDWSTNARGGPITDWEVSLSGFGTRPGEIVQVPHGGRELAPGLEVMVLYADEQTITLKYTPEDNVVWGYTVHLYGVCVDPRLLALYRQLDAAGRAELPALRGEQPLGRARSGEVLVSIRDTGAFMDPRVRKDWW